MTAIREPGKINENTTLIETGLFGVAGACAIYLIEAGKTCLIDTGSPAEASRIIKSLKKADAFPPDYLLLTHSHWDHTQAIPILRKKGMGDTEVMASERAIPLLEDQSWNSFADPKGTFASIKDVTPLKEGDTIDLDGLALRIYGVPGHIKDHIAAFDETTKNIFIGDAIGMKVADQALLSVPMAPFFSKEDYLATFDKLGQIDYESLCLSHFGYIYGEEARTILDESRTVFNKVWEIYEAAEQNGKLDDINYLIEVVLQELNPVIPDFRVEKFIGRFMLGAINGGRKILRKPPISTANMLLKEITEWSVEGYKIYKKID